MDLQTRSKKHSKTDSNACYIERSESENDDAAATRQMVLAQILLHIGDEIVKTTIIWLDTISIGSVSRFPRENNNEESHAEPIVLVASDQIHTVRVHQEWLQRKFSIVQIDAEQQSQWEILLCIGREMIKVAIVSSSCFISISSVSRLPRQHNPYVMSPTVSHKLFTFLSDQESSKEACGTSGTPPQKDERKNAVPEAERIKSNALKEAKKIKWDAIIEASTIKYDAHKIRAEAHIEAGKIESKARKIKSKAYMEADRIESNAKIVASTMRAEAHLEVGEIKAKAIREASKIITDAKNKARNIKLEAITRANHLKCETKENISEPD